MFYDETGKKEHFPNIFVDTINEIFKLHGVV